MSYPFVNLVQAHANTIAAVEHTKKNLLHTLHMKFITKKCFAKKILHEHLCNKNFFSTVIEKNLHNIDKLVYTCCIRIV